MDSSATCGPHTGVFVIDTATNTLDGSPIPVGCEPASIAITPDGLQVYVANAFDDTISVIDAATSTVASTIFLPQSAAPAAIAITPDGKRAYVTARTTSGKIFIIDTNSNTVLGPPIAVGTAPHGIAITSDGKSAYVTDNVELGSVFVIDIATGVVSNSIPVGNYPMAVAFTPDEKFAYIANGEFSVSVVDTLSQAVVGNPIDVGNHPNAIAVTADGKQAYVSNEDSNSVSVIDTARNMVTATINGMGSPRGVATRPLPGNPPTLPTVTPVVTGKLGTNGWYVSPTAITWKVTGTPTPTTSGCKTASVPNTTGKTYRCTATNSLGSATDSITIKRDTVKPTVTITMPANGATYAFKSTVLASYTCADATSGVASCSGTRAVGAKIPTGTKGNHNFHVEAIDNAGNRFGQTLSYTVQ